ncbi:hypothetical protein [Thalassomonas haliotis]|uniref:Glycoside hydrolase family 57 N-terminal domain-containing protein n=1 Tax=Thalassomonas haliotis TaxID=485448 RepID=A0ABY7VDH2_9GAMM|nr:hypothetical protein [Thalassomonas haliotis]WDE11445.1 hypothetical protein H3N35_25060 [Thalassomonas haliotis]
MAQPSSIKYVLYTHYNYMEGKDFKLFSDFKELKNQEQRKDLSTLAINEAEKDVQADFDFQQLSGIGYLEKHFPQLKELLTSKLEEGNLVIFYSTGFADCLDGIAEGKTRAELLAEHKEIEFSYRYGQSLVKYMRSFYPELVARVRIITPIDLYDIFGRLHKLTADNLRWWFIGKSKAIHYDTPKSVEALLRLRLLGSGVPVFRLDHDVIFRGGEDTESNKLGLFSVISACIRTYQHCLQDPNVATFLLSASYDSQTLTGENKDKLEGWRGAFATRVFPALKVDKNILQKVGQVVEDEKKGSKSLFTWESYAEAVFSSDLARDFYGLTSKNSAATEVKGIGKIGAHPFTSIISGAMLCLSDGAILDLPPFSNFTLNVMWIDDHLKYGLHRELRHLITMKSDDELLFDIARQNGVMVKKKRAKIDNLPSYVLGSYLPTLLWGAVMDAWLNPNPLPKYLSGTPSESDTGRWGEVKRHGRSQGVFASALQLALEKGVFTTPDRFQVKNALIEVGLQRITEVRNQWAKLTAGDEGKEVETFASIWAKGTVSDYFPELADKCYGMAHKSINEREGDKKEELKKTTDLNEFQLHDDFLTLVEDALEYIEWTLNWPKIVQVVRSIEQGAVKTDLSWEPE